MGEDPRNDGRNHVALVPTRGLADPEDLWSVIHKKNLGERHLP